MLELSLANRFKRSARTYSCRFDSFWCRTFCKCCNRRSSFVSGFQVLFNTEKSAYKCYVLPLMGQIKSSASEQLDAASPCKILEMRFLFSEPRFSYFHFSRGEKMPIGSCMGVVAGFRLLKHLSSFHKIGYERYSVCSDTIMFFI